MSSFSYRSWRINKCSTSSLSSLCNRSWCLNWFWRSYNWLLSFCKLNRSRHNILFLNFFLLFSKSDMLVDNIIPLFLFFLDFLLFFHFLHQKCLLFLFLLFFCRFNSISDQSLLLLLLFLLFIIHLLLNKIHGCHDLLGIFFLFLSLFHGLNLLIKFGLCVKILRSLFNNTTSTILMIINDSDIKLLLISI